jgi:hypothetical protein
VSNPVNYSNAIEACVRQNTDSPKYLYHYTSQASADHIQESGELAASASGHLGGGSYFTAKAPRSSTANLLHNNYRSEAEHLMSKTQAYVRVDADKVNALSGRAALGRDVFVVPSNVNLAEAAGRVGKRY